MTDLREKECDLCGQRMGDNPGKRCINEHYICGKHSQYFGSNCPIGTCGAQLPR